jgi:hypothetical protein
MPCVTQTVSAQIGGEQVDLKRTAWRGIDDGVEYDADGRE